MRKAEYLRKAEEAAEMVTRLESWLAKLREEAANLEEAIAIEREREQKYRGLAGGVTNEVLHIRERSGNISDVTRKHHALAIAKKAAGADPFRLHITKRGMSQNKVAKKAGCSNAALSRYRSGRPVPTTIANRIQAATDWPADAEHWPGGLV